MKNILSAVLLAAVLSLLAAAQDARVPSVVINQDGEMSTHGTTGSTWGLPSVPGTILFYGGDTNTSDPNQTGFANGNTLLVPLTEVLAAVTAPKNGGKIVTSAVFFNQVATGTSNPFDPPTGTYDVRTNVSDGNCGTELTSGSGPQTAVLTGRKPFGAPEYTTTVSFAKPLTAKDGTTYWFNESPQCTDSSNGTCASEQFFFDNTTQQTNGVNANAQPKGQMFLDSNFFGFVCKNLCDDAPNSQQCAWGSWGLLK
jgi:hypothetical protein